MSLGSLDSLGCILCCLGFEIFLVLATPDRHTWRHVRLGCILRCLGFEVLLVLATPNRHARWHVRLCVLCVLCVLCLLRLGRFGLLVGQVLWVFDRRAGCCAGLLARALRLRLLRVGELVVGRLGLLGWCLVAACDAMHEVRVDAWHDLASLRALRSLRSLFPFGKGLGLFGAVKAPCGDVRR